ncbi:MAG: hypothetical protein ACRECX_13285 [Methyloceanibacter sp.]|uniref:hypothetical protein n=1 Tax=Methyloceanibacter sp. TaxID=1965321 RepID=UPI003D6D2B29
MPTISKSPEEAALQLTRENMTWAAEFGEAAGPITYGFRATPPAHENSRGVKATFTPFTESQIEAATLAINLWADIANITFEQVTDGDSPYANSATILFGNYYSQSDGAAAYSNYPSAALTDPKYSSGDVWVNQYYQPSSESYSLMILLHERNITPDRTLSLLITTTPNIWRTAASIL